MGGGTGSGSIDNEGLKLRFNLEHITKAGSNGPVETKIGFSKGRFLILRVRGYECDFREIHIGDSLYDLFKSQAQKGSYKSAKEFFEALESQREPINY